MKHQLTLGDYSNIDKSKPVKVYKNLHKDCYSVQQDGIVVAWVNNLILTEAQFLVNKAGRNKVLETKKKNVHAFVSGYWTPTWDFGSTVFVSYNPYKADCFLAEKTTPINRAKAVLLGISGLYAEV